MATPEPLGFLRLGVLVAVERQFLAQDILEREARVLALAAKVALDFRALLRATQRLDRQRDAALFRVDADDFGFDFVTGLVEALRLVDPLGGELRDVDETFDAL